MKKDQDLIGLLRKQTHSSIDPELLSWEVWTNELIKWSEQRYKYPMPVKSEIKADRVMSTYKKYLALFLKELNDKGPVLVNNNELVNNSVYSNAKLSGSKRSHDQMVSVEESKLEETKISVQRNDNVQIRKQEMNSHMSRADSFKAQPIRALSLEHRKSSSMSTAGNEVKHIPMENIRSEPRIETNIYTDIPSRVRNSISKIYNISNKIKQIKDEYEENNGTLQAINLSNLNMQPEKLEFTVENVLKTIEEINERPAKIVENAFMNVYKRKNEW